MPGLDILNDWEKLKKHGFPALIVALVWAVTSLTGLFQPKDPSCEQANKFLESQLDTAYTTIRKIAKDDQADRITIRNLLIEKQKTDSLLRAKTEIPAKIILNRKR